MQFRTETAWKFEAMCGSKLSQINHGDTLALLPLGPIGGGVSAIIIDGIMKGLTTPTPLYVPSLGQTLG
jgi:hypothetical protein